MDFKKILKKVLPLSYFYWLKEIVLRVKTILYRKNIAFLEKEIFSKKKINVVFFAINVSMWKYDSLFQLMLAHPRFNPIIVSSLGYSMSKEVKIREQEAMKYYFSDYKKYPFVEGYNAEKDKWYDVKDKIKPDLIFYTQPYDKNPYIGYNIVNFYKTSLFAYVPYSFGIEGGRWPYNALLQNVAWKVYYPTELHLRDAMTMSFVKGKNVVVAGYPLADDFLSNNLNDPWKIKERRIKRIIWAPHHSILPTDILNYSNFLEIADEMFEIAVRYKDYIQIAFKPHPSLKNKLYRLSDWGIERTDIYYQKWKELPNGILSEGNYIDLFVTSDAMVHDCSSFSVEYLYTKKPVMFLSKEDHLNYLCDFGKLAFDVHYKGFTIKDIEQFIKEIVINENDSMKFLRENFYTKYLKGNENTTVAENILIDLLNCFQ